jgi:hypothetical protein
MREFAQETLNRLHPERSEKPVSIERHAAQKETGPSLRSG